eukprot:scaffold22246_cov77-Phaeocystis_antarctica.AAC.1
MCRFLCRKPRRNESSFLVFVRKGRLRQPPGRAQAKEVQTRLGLVRGNTRRNRAERCARPCAQSYMYMYVTLSARILESLSANSPPTDRSATLARSHGARRRGGECRRPVRSAAARRSARAEQRQDDVMTPAGPTDTTSAPSRASRCACVAGVLSHLGGTGQLLLLPRTRRAAERAPRPIDRHMAARRVKRGYRGLAPLRWRREERRPVEHLAAALDPESSRRAAGPSPRSPAALPVS